MKVWFIKIISAAVHQVHIIAGEVHPQRNIGVMSRVVIQQGYKKPDAGHQSQQAEKKRIIISGQNRLLRGSHSDSKVNKVAGVLMNGSLFRGYGSILDKNQLCADTRY